MAAKSCRKIDVLLVADQILGSLQDAREPMNITEISRLTGISVDTVFRQLGTMLDMRWVEKIGDGYILGMRIAVFRAKKKAVLEAQRDDIDRKLMELEEC